MTPYEQANKARHRDTGGRSGRAIVLEDGTTFWSRGAGGCDRCGGDMTRPVHLERFEERRGTTVVSGWRCPR